MRFFLFLCFLGSCLAWDPTNCTSAFTNVLPLLLKNAQDVKTLCQSPSEMAKAKQTIKGTLKRCGLNNWATSNVADDKTLGPMIAGILDYAEKMLCTQESGLFCFPQAMTVLDLTVILNVFKNAQSQLAANTFSWDQLDLSCKILADPAKIEKMCGSSNAHTRCVHNFGRQFDKIIKTLRFKLDANGVMNAGVKKNFHPLSKLALTLQKACRPSQRKLAIFFDGCGAGTSQPKKNLTVADIKAKVCASGGGTNPAVLGYLNKNLQHVVGGGIVDITVSGGERITRDKINTWCCDAACQKVQKAKLRAHYLTKTIVGATNIYAECMSDPAGCHKALCEDACANMPVGNPATDCKVTRLRQGSLIVELEINATEPISCGDNAASQYSIDNLKTNSTQVSVTDCACVGCPVSSSATGASARNGSATSGAGALSFSFIGLLSSLFILCVVRW